MNSLLLPLLKETVDLRATISATIPSLMDLIEQPFFDSQAISTLGQLAQHGASHLKFSVLH
jgi:hypothetical protein